VFWLGIIVGFAVGGVGGYFVGRNYGTLKQTKL
jgi:hypothetical protein